MSAGGAVRRCRCSSAPSRSIRISRLRMRSWGSTTASSESRLWRSRARARPTSCAIARATAIVLHHDDLRPAGDRQPGTGATTLAPWAQTYPRDAYPPGLLAGFMTRSTGQYELSIEEAEKAIALDPDGALAPSFHSKAISELYLNRLADAEATIRQAMEEHKLEFADFDLLRYFIAFLKGDADDIARKATLARAKRPTEDMISHVEALVLARSGRLQDARRTSAIAVDISERSGHHERAATFETATAVWEAFYGNCGGRRREGRQSRRARQGPRGGLRRRLRSGRRGRHRSIPDSCR